MIYRPPNDFNPEPFDDRPIDRRATKAWWQPLVYLGLGVAGATSVILGDRWLQSTALPPEAAAQPSPVQPEAKPVAAPTSGGTARLLAANNPNFIAAAAERVGPAVVRIDSSRTVSARLPNIFNRGFFGEPTNPSQSPRTRVEEGTGSGFIIDSNGLILTNAHVVDGADQGHRPFHKAGHLVQQPVIGGPRSAPRRQPGRRHRRRSSPCAARGRASRRRPAVFPGTPRTPPAANGSGARNRWPCVVLPKGRTPRPRTGGQAR
ncbi:MAG: hypothetical protein HC895_21835, partial [Leptolyngbyaceae cyanobacterium SM1_3_5]|nr:hypothetical protein [Leptolyngbyaceae cyanobacterium SM1_3_5]